jgi:hypothetical protein
MNKNIFAVKIVETLSRVIVIEAENEQDAMDTAKEMYDTAQIILDYDDFSDSEIYTLEIFDETNNRLTRQEIENMYGDIIPSLSLSQNETV